MRTRSRGATSRAEGLEVITKATRGKSSEAGRGQRRDKGGGGRGGRVAKRTPSKHALSTVRSGNGDVRLSRDANGSRAHKKEIIDVDDEEEEEGEKEEYSEDRSDAEEDVSDDEFEVEAIRDHKKESRGTIKYYLKWKGWPESANTWEDAKNVHCDELIDEYWEKQKAKTAESSRRLSAVDPSSTKSPARIARSSMWQLASSRSPGGTPLRSEMSYSARSSSGNCLPKKPSHLQDAPPEGKKKNVVERCRGSPQAPPREQWEDEAVAVLSVEMDAHGLMAEVEWASGIITRHSAAVLRDWIPKKLVDYYQARIHFIEG